MGRWARERDFDALVGVAVDSATNTLGPWAPLTREQAIAAVKALIAKESGFQPDRVRGEPQIGDASVGLMQVLYSTAKGLGYPGPVGSPQGLTGLFAPGTNIYLGTKYLHQLLSKTGGDLDAAWSAYNGGYRPSLGFGARRTASSPRVCLRWKVTAPATGRTVARDCEVVGDTEAGKFSNQSRYVDAVRNYYAYFFGPGPLAAGQTPPPLSPAPTG
jgi:soluble lytic murein transglycosylase-like protein